MSQPRLANASGRHALPLAREAGRQNPYPGGEGVQAWPQVYDSRMDLLLARAARMLGLPRAGLTPEAAAAAFAERPGDAAEELFVEVAASDDVTGRESAMAYLDARLDELAPLLPDAATAAAIRTAFTSRLAAWDRVP